MSLSKKIKTAMQQSYKYTHTYIHVYVHVTSLVVVQWLRIQLAMQGTQGLIPGQGTRTPHVVGQLSLCAMLCN